MLYFLELAVGMVEPLYKGHLSKEDSAYSYVATQRCVQNYFRSEDTSLMRTVHTPT